MPSVRDTRAWSSKPPLSAQINWAHPWAFGLVAFWSFREGSGTPIELVSGTLPTATAFTWKQTALGSAGSFNGTTSDLSYANLPAVGPAISLAGSCTVVNSNAAGTFIERSNVNATWEIFNNDTAQGVIWRGANGTNRNKMPNTGLSGVRFCWGVADDGTGTGASNGSTMYMNGVAQAASGTNANAVPASNTNAIHLGSLDGTIFNLSGTQDYVAMWNYKLAASDMSAIGSNPNAIWQLFQPARGLWLFPSVAAGATGWTGKLAGRGGGLVGGGMAGRSGLAG